MKRIVALLLATFSLPAFSEVYICEAKAGAGVRHGGNKDMGVSIVDTTNLKYVLSNSNGKWVLTRLDFGPEYPIFRECQTQYYCKDSHGDFVSGDYFFHTKDGYFELVYSRITNIQSANDLKDPSKPEDTLYAVKGRCQKL